MSDEVLVERRGAVQGITINRPEARNALNGAVAAGIRDAADELDADGALRVGVLTGAGGTFSSGVDLKAFLKGETPSFPGRGLAGITQTPPRKPMIAAAEGYALAGGFELAMACDLVVAGTSAKFGVPEVKRSLVAGAGGALLLARRIPARARAGIPAHRGPVRRPPGLRDRAGQPRCGRRPGARRGDRAGRQDRGQRAAGADGHQGDLQRRRRLVGRRTLGRDGPHHGAGVHLAGRAGRGPGVRREARSGLEGTVSMRRGLYEEDHEAFREVVQAFVKREVTPNQQRWDEEHLVGRQAWLAAGK